MNENSERRKVSFVKLFNVLEVGNGTVNIFNLLGFLKEGEFQFEEFPQFIFNIESDRTILENLFEHYKAGGLFSAEEYLQQLQ